MMFLCREPESLGEIDAGEVSSQVCVLVSNDAVVLFRSNGEILWMHFSLHGCNLL